MKKIFIEMALLIALISVSAILMSNKTGAVAEYCGDPASGFENCTYCHNDGSATYEAGMITSNIPASGYLGDSIYTITATITSNGTSKFGFEISPQDSAGNLRGTMTVGGTDMQLVGSNGKYITHTLSGNSGTNTRTWTFTWKAPSAGTGTVTFYGAFNAADNDNTDQGDNILLSRLMVKDASLSVGFTASSTKSDGCYNQNNGNATVTPIGGTSPFAYKWSNSSGIIPTATTQTISGLSADTYKCTITDSHSPLPDTFIVTVTIINPPELTSTIQSPVNILCRGEKTGVATVTVNGGTGTKTYAWSPSGGNAVSATGLAAGTYTVTVTDANNCSTTATITLTEPATSLTANPTTSSGTAIANASGGTPPYTYLWAPSGGNGDTATGLISGNYTVTVTDKNGCTVTQTIQVVSGGINRIEHLRASIKMYPNPNNGKFSIQVNSSVNKIYSVKVTNTIGQLVYSEPIELKSGINILQVDLSSLNKGLHFLQIFSDQGVVNIPFNIDL